MTRVSRIDLNASRPPVDRVMSRNIKQRNLVWNPRFHNDAANWTGATRSVSPGSALPTGADACGGGNPFTTVIYANDYDHTEKFVPGDIYSVRGDFYSPNTGRTLEFEVLWADSGESSEVYNDTVPASFTSESAVVTVPTVEGYETGFAYATLKVAVTNGGV